MAACGRLNGAAVEFEICLDVPFGGVLCALPALEANGLLAHLNLLGQLPPGYYTILPILLLLAFMSLLRIKTVESLRGHSPGERGILIGLDRIPEVRCLRSKMAYLAKNEASVAAWANALTRDWMQFDPEMAGFVYIDGHARVYNGHKSQLPRRYVARQKLCLPAVIDYWVNDREGKPFFYIERPIDDGLLAVLGSEIVPQLLKDMPNQPSSEALADIPWLYRFNMLFDRAGCSPQFFKEMWTTHRIACTTYLKNPEAAWPEAEFRKVLVVRVSGQTEEMELAERGIVFGKDKGQAIWCREFRRLRRGKHSNHQTAIVSTNYTDDLEKHVPYMFDRWCQENFFRYMIQEFSLNLMAEHKTESFPCSIPVLNPEWKELDATCRSLRGKVAVAKVKFGELELRMDDAVGTKKFEQQLNAKKSIFEEYKTLADLLDKAREKRRNTHKHIPFDTLPDEHKFERLAPTRKLFHDTIRMIAYRAETALAAQLRPFTNSPDEARSMLKALYKTTADLYPDQERKQLRVVLHTLGEPRLNRAVNALLAELNATECDYPGTDLKLVYELIVTPQPPAEKRPASSEN